jgi:hypothetical protein
MLVQVLTLDQVRLSRESDIIWYHNHLRSRNRYLLETGAANFQAEL